MSRTATYALVAFCAALLLVPPAGLHAAESKSSKPNIVFILADDLGWADVGYHGPDIKTPNILFIVADDLGYGDISVYGCKDFATANLDRVAMQGTRFTKGYVAAPVCSPSRAGFVTLREGFITELESPIEPILIPLRLAISRCETLHKASSSPHP